MKIGDVEFYITSTDSRKAIGRCPDCENCPMSWEDMSYEGECLDCGCTFSDNDFNTPEWKCFLPHWIKKIAKRQIEGRQERYWNKVSEQYWKEHKGDIE